MRPSLRLDGKKVCNIKMVGISQAESNNIKACVVPSIHLPLLKGGKCDGAVRGIVRFWKGWCGAMAVSDNNIKAVTAYHRYRFILIIAFLIPPFCYSSNSSDNSKGGI